MENRLRRLFAAILIAGTAAACTDSSFTAPDPQFELVPIAGCELLASITTAVYDWFPDPERLEAKQKLAALDAACRTGAQAAATQYAGELLSLMELVLNAGRGGVPATGSSLTNGLLACTASLCEQTSWPGIDFGPALSAGGLFAFRTGTNSMAGIARSATAFNGSDGLPNSALWGVESSLPWTQINKTNVVLLFGSPVLNDPLNLQDPGISGLQYDVKRWPVNGMFASDGIVHVSVCFGREVTLPHDANDHSVQPRMQRERTLLTTWQPGFCPPASTPATASLLAPAFAVVRSLLPARWSAVAVTDVKTRHVGGSALDFSRFAPVGAGTSGGFELVDGPPATTKKGESLGTIRIRALSGGGTGIENVRVTLSVYNNRGVPAGAVLLGPTVAYTDELNGMAVFTDPYIEKPGGYIICATAELHGFTFEQQCFPQFHIRP